MLDGKTILIVEAEFLIALDSQRILEAQGARDIVFARSADEALQRESGMYDFGLALIDISSANESALALHDRLIENGVPVIFSSSNTGFRNGVSGIEKTPVLIKPFSEADLLAACSRVLPAV